MSEPSTQAWHADILHRKAPAKLNLYLHVTGRREDGYHLLDSLIAFADVADDVSFHEAPVLELIVDGPFAALLEDSREGASSPAGRRGDHANLALRAAHLMREIAKDESRGALIRLTKNLPVAAGLGGGSADAAVVLHGLNELWDTGVAEAELARRALALGADVPACLYGRPLIASGIGDVLAPVQIPDGLWVVLANPGVTLDTGRVFRSLGDIGSPSTPMPGHADIATFLDALAGRRNDLTGAAIALAPEIGHVLNELDAFDHCLLTRMSGSGATCFGLFSDPDQAKAAAQALDARHPQWWVADGRLLA